MATPPTLPIPEDVNISPGSEIQEKARVLKANFGGGYVQRSGDGINSVIGNYNVVFENLRRSEAKTLVDFFRAQRGYKAFYFTVPGDPAPRLWTCEEWTRRHVGGIFDSVAATFMEVFNP